MSVSRPVAVGVLSLLALGSAATGAAAQTSIDVSAAANAGSRQFFVEDLTGTSLTALDLGTSGQGSLFQTRVKDTDFTATGAPFTASAEMTNLYLENAQGAPVYGTKVASDKLSLSYAAVPTDVAGVSLAAVPKIRVTGLLPACDDLSGLLSGTTSTLLGSGSLLGGLLGPLGLSNAAAPLCSALGGAADPTGPVLDAADGVVVPIAERVLEPALDALTGLPVSLGTSESGAFTNPSYLGVGEDDPAAGGTATPLKVLGGGANSSLNLNDLVSPLLNGVPLFSASPTGTDGLTSVSSLVSSLQASTDTGIAAVGNALAGLSALEQTKILSGVVPNGATPVASLLSTTLDRISGTYRSFPRLSANLAGAPTGSYTGTMTITFVQQ